MLVKAREDVFDYGPLKRIIKDKIYLVVAIEKFDNYEEFYVIDLNNIDLKGENDPLPFETKYFDIVNRDFTEEWIEKSPTYTRSKSILSFKEWFDNGFYYRAHDWDLKDEDYKILNKYLATYSSQNEAN